MKEPSKEHPDEASDMEIATGIAHAPSPFLVRVLKRLGRVERELESRQDHVYKHKLGVIKPGRVFMMCNYTGVFMRVRSTDDVLVSYTAAINTSSHAFNDDGVHVPIVDLASGHLFFMSKEKPCMLFPGESP